MPARKCGGVAGWSEHQRRKMAEGHSNGVSGLNDMRPTLGARVASALGQVSPMLDQAQRKGTALNGSKLGARVLQRVAEACVHGLQKNIFWPTGSY